MNYDVSSEKLSVCNLMFEGCREIPIDLDFSLPDYCPDVQKILKCQVLPGINSRNISGDRLNIEGITNVRIIYLSEETGNIRCYENSAPFSVSMDIKATPENAVAFTFAKTEYVNCRAVSPRKIDIHGAFSVCAKIYNKSEKNISCCVNGKDIQQKIKSAPVSALASIGQQQLTLNEVLNNENSVSPELLVNGIMSVSFNDYKVMPGKVVAKGEAILKVLFIDDLSTGNLATGEYRIPISQIVDMPGAKEEDKYIMVGEVLAHNEKIYPGNGENRNMISLEAKIAVTMMAYEEKEIGVVTDIYSTKYDLDVKNSDVTLSHLESVINESFDQKTSISTENGKISEIIDIWCETCSSIREKDKEKPVFKIKNKMNICILAYDENKAPFYIERPIEFEYEKEFENLSDNIDCKVTVLTKSIGYRLPSENTVDLKLSCEIYANIFKNFGCNMVTSAECDEENPIEKDRTNALTVYYADENECLWDIARKYHTSIHLVRAENDIPEDVEQKSGMLLIPIK